MTKILIIAGPSASGKTTVAHKLLKKDESFEFVRSVTTRQPRADSFDNEYIYLSRAEFEEKISDDEVLEYTEYAGNLYGTPRFEIERITSAGKTPLLILDLCGVRKLVRDDNGIMACVLYIYDTLDVMERRLYDRYLGLDKTSEGLARFVSRKEQNIRDFLSLQEMQDVFYSLVRNDATPYECAETIEDIYSSFLRGTPPDLLANENTILTLKSEAESKIR